jgi:hypothetical protein
MLRLTCVSGFFALFFLCGCLPAAHYRYDKHDCHDTLSVHPKDSAYLLMQKFADLPDTKIDPLDTILAAFGERSGMLASAANGLLGYAVSAAKTAIANEKSKYTTTTNYGNTEDYFYAQPSLAGPFDPSGMQFTGFDLIRTIKKKGGGIDTALFATFEVDTSQAQEILNNFVFRLKLTKFWLRYVKPKVEMWSKRKMSVEFNISFLTSLITPDGRMEDSVVLGKFHCLLNNISIRHGDAQFGLCTKNEKERQVSGKAFIVPRSYGYFKKAGKIVPGFNQGSYSIIVSMKECTKPIFMTKMIIENGATLLDDVPKDAGSQYIPKKMP